MEVDEILRKIIIQELDIEENRVVFYNQNWNPPKDGGLYIILSTRSSKILGNNNFYQPTTSEELEEVKQTVLFTSIDIDITSKNRTAMERKEEVLMSLVSSYSQIQQEKYCIRIFRPETILDLSFIEGGSALNRFRIPVTITSIKTKTTNIDYYDKFQKEELLDE
jgi:hypothetical protein